MSATGATVHRPVEFDHGLAELARIARDVCNYCDHVEHNEEADVEWIRGAGSRLRELAVALASHRERDLREDYSLRLLEIEQRNVAILVADYDGCRAARSCTSLRDFQAVQLRHDRAYHLDVVGLAKLEQLRHCALHVAKLAGHAADAAAAASHGWETDKRVADCLIFGLKLATLTGESLDDSPTPFIEPA